jgi:hypothetical protein
VGVTEPELKRQRVGDEQQRFFARFSLKGEDQQRFILRFIMGKDGGEKFFARGFENVKTASRTDNVTFIRHPETGKYLRCCLRQPPFSPPRTTAGFMRRRSGNGTSTILSDLGYTGDRLLLFCVTIFVPYDGLLYVPIPLIIVYASMIYVTMCYDTIMIYDLWIQLGWDEL